MISRKKIFWTPTDSASNSTKASEQVAKARAIAAARARVAGAAGPGGGEGRLFLSRVAARKAFSCPDTAPA